MLLPQLLMGKLALSRRSLPLCSFQVTYFNECVPVHNTQLDQGLCECGISRLGETLKAIDADNYNIFRALILKLSEHTQLERSRFILGQSQA